MVASSPSPVEHPVARLLTPSSIAVVGASPDLTRIRGVLLHRLRENGFAGRLYAVNPHYNEINGISCYPRLSAIGANVDLALIAVPAAHVLSALEDCAAAGVGRVVVISSGFAEEGGAKQGLQRQLAAFAQARGIRICGPNAEGFHNEIAHVSATFSPAVDGSVDRQIRAPSSKRIGIVAQSGGVGFSLYQRIRAYGLSVSYVVSTGNEADLTATDFLDYMVTDQSTAALLVFLEEVRDPAAFVAVIARAAQQRKPLVVIKIGCSEAGERAALSHTASLAGWAGGYAAAFATYGVLTAFDPDEAVAILALMLNCGTPKGGRVCVLTTSGGAGAWVADTLVAAGLAVPELAATTQAALRKLIPAYGSPRNPVDVTAQGAPTSALINAVQLLSASDEIDAIVVVLSTIRAARVPLGPASLQEFMRAKPIIVYSYTLPSTLARTSVVEAGSIAITNLQVLGRSMAAVVQHGRFEQPARPVPDRPSAELYRWLANNRGALTEYESKRALRQYGIGGVPPNFLVRSREQIRGIHTKVRFPVAAKLQSRDLPHKTAVGGVQLNIADARKLEEVFDSLIAGVMANHPEARVDGVLVEPMAPPGIEVIVGAVRDRLFGPVLMVGSGGTAAELIQDVSFRLAPVNQKEALLMLAQLRDRRWSGMDRQFKAADIGALAKLIAELSAFATACRDLAQEIELNPVIVHRPGHGCTVADALMVVEPAPSR